MFFDPGRDSSLPHFGSASVTNKIQPDERPSNICISTSLQFKSPVAPGNSAFASLRAKFFLLESCLTIPLPLLALLLFTKQTGFPI